MTLVKNFFNLKSPYVRMAIKQCKSKNKFHIEEFEEVIKIEDFFEELLDISDKEKRKCKS